jgi:hypothetical protein
MMMFSMIASMMMVYWRGWHAGQPRTVAAWLLIDLLDDWFEEAHGVERDQICDLWRDYDAARTMEAFDEVDESLEQDHIIRADRLRLESECLELREVPDHV